MLRASLLIIISAERKTDLMKSSQFLLANHRSDKSSSISHDGDRDVPIRNTLPLTKGECDTKK